MKWLERSLVNGGYLCLCIDEKGFHRTMRWMKIPQPWPRWIGEGADATTHGFSNNSLRSYASVVCVRPDFTRTGIEIAGILVHESVHVFQRWCEESGESAPSSEFQAYSIQNLSSRLMDAYVELVNKQKLVRKCMRCATTFRQKKQDKARKYCLACDRIMKR